MSLGLVGRKVGMMRIFKEDGTSVPVTVLDCGGNRITRIKTSESDGYSAIQVAFGKRRATRVTKPLAGQYAKAGVEAGSVLREFRVDSKEVAELKVGGELKVDMFGGRPKGRRLGHDHRQGRGVIKRHHFSSNRASHGNRCRTPPGSIGMAQDPGRVSRASAWPATSAT